MFEKRQPGHLASIASQVSASGAGTLCTFACRAMRYVGDAHYLTLSMRSVYASALYRDAAATLDDLREAVATLEDTVRIARRVLGGAHPLTAQIERGLRESRKGLAIGEASVGNSDDVSAVRGALEAMNAT